VNYYNEFEPYAAQWLRNLIAAGLIPEGHVDTRSITDVQPDDLAGYRQCHFFAGIGGWPLAARLAGWPDDRQLWTGSTPCQPFSVAGKGKGQDDDRHLWPHFFGLIRARRPAAFLGEQVAAAVGKAWLDGVLDDLEGIDYAGRAVVVPACAAKAPPRADGGGARHGRAVESGGSDDFWHSAIRITGHDAKGRRIEPSIPLLAHGIPGRVGRLRAYGNAIVPQVAAEVIGAYMDCYPEISP